MDAQRVDLGKLAVFFAWIALNFFAQSFLWVGGFFGFFSAVAILQGFAGVPNHAAEFVVGAASLAGLISGCFVNIAMFPLLYWARFPSIGFGGALFIVFLTGTTFWLGLFAIDAMASGALLPEWPSNGWLAAPYLFALISVAMNTLFARWHRFQYRLWYREGGLLDRWYQRDMRVYLGEDAWQRYYEWLWGHPPPEQAIEH